MGGTREASRMMVDKGRTLGHERTVFIEGEACLVTFAIGKRNGKYVGSVTKLPISKMDIHEDGEKYECIENEEFDIAFQILEREGITISELRMRKGVPYVA